MLAIYNFLSLQVMARICLFDSWMIVHVSFGITSVSNGVWRIFIRGQAPGRAGGICCLQRGSAEDFLLPKGQISARRMLGCSHAFFVSKQTGVAANRLSYIVHKLFLQTLQILLLSGVLPLVVFAGAIDLVRSFDKQLSTPWTRFWLFDPPFCSTLQKRACKNAPIRHATRLNNLSGCLTPNRL
jgi:hypothetical protein